MEFHSSARQEEMAENPRATSFYKAMKLSLGVVLILDKDATPFSRIWCCFEESIAVAQPKLSITAHCDGVSGSPL